MTKRMKAGLTGEREVFAEIDKTLPVYPALRIKRVLSYKVLDKILRANENPDYFAGLPMQTAEAVVHQAVNDFLNVSVTTAVR